MSILHRFLGESLITLSLLGVLLALFLRGGAAGSLERISRTVLTAFGILLSIQWVLGIANYFGLGADVRPGLAHPVLMTLLVAGFHMSQGKIKKGEWSGRWPLVGLYAGSWVLIFVGLQLL